MRQIVKQVNLPPPAERRVSTKGVSNQISPFLRCFRPTISDSTREPRPGPTVTVLFKPRRNTRRAKESPPGQEKGRATIYLSIDHSPISAKEGSSGGGENHGQRKSANPHAENRISDREKSESPHIHLVPRPYRARINLRGEPRAEEEASGRISFETSSIFLSFLLGQNTQPYIDQ